MGTSEHVAIKDKNTGEYGTRVLNRGYLSVLTEVIAFLKQILKIRNCNTGRLVTVAMAYVSSQ